MTTHDLKLHESWFDDVASGRKNFEIRKNDRDYKVGDTLILREWNENGYTSFAIFAEITYVLRHDNFPQGLCEGYCALGIRVTDIRKIR